MVFASLNELSALYKLAIVITILQTCDSVLTKTSKVEKANIYNVSFKALNFGLPITGQKLNITPLETHTAKNRIGCMQKCTQVLGCVSTNLGPANANGEHVCELLELDRYNGHGNFVVEPEWTYMGLKTKCDTNPCGGKPCISNYGNDNQYICLDKEFDTSCKALMDKGAVTSNVYAIYVNKTMTPVYCDQVTDGGGWIMMQRKEKGLSFTNTWQEYKEGFGHLSRNMWWGNEKVHLVSNATAYELRFDFTLPDGSVHHQVYPDFWINGEDDGYRLYLNSPDVYGIIGNPLSSGGFPAHLNPFATPDQPNHCAQERNSGWWYGYCGLGFPNKDTLIWSTWSEASKTVLTEMKIRPM